jgi:maltose O-acetyltransferase
VYINKLKNAIGKTVRRLNVGRYRLLGVKIGKNVFISHKAKIDTSYPDSIEIGDGCYITYEAMIIAHDHSVYRHVAGDDGRGKVILERNVFLGSRAVVLRNVRIGENSIIAAGAVVTEDIPANVIVAGNPARIIRSFEPI